MRKGLGKANEKGPPLHEVKVFRSRCQKDLVWFDEEFNCGCTPRLFCAEDKKHKTTHTGECPINSEAIDPEVAISNHGRLQHRHHRRRRWFSCGNHQASGGLRRQLAGASNNKTNPYPGLNPGPPDCGAIRYHLGRLCSCPEGHHSQVKRKGSVLQGSRALR